MPISEIHHRKKLKNYALLAVLISLMATFFFVTIVKFEENKEHARQQQSK